MDRLKHWMLRGHLRAQLNRGEARRSHGAVCSLQSGLGRRPQGVRALLCLGGDPAKPQLYLQQAWRSAALGGSSGNRNTHEVLRLSSESLLV
jgi:hypothetical protein